MGQSPAARQPVFQRTTFATLDGALGGVFHEGDAIRRPDYPEGDCVMMHEGRLRVRISGVFHDWIITEPDIEAEDWETLSKETLQ